MDRINFLTRKDLALLYGIGKAQASKLFKEISELYGSQHKTHLCVNHVIDYSGLTRDDITATLSDREPSKTED